MNSTYFCPICKSPVAFEEKYCGNCGTHLDWNTPQSTQPSTPASSEFQSYQQRESFGEQSSLNTTGLKKKYQRQHKQQYWKGRYYSVREEKRFSSGILFIAASLFVVFVIVGIGFSTNWSFFNLFSLVGNQSVALLPSDPSEPVSTDSPEVESPQENTRLTDTSITPETTQVPQIETSNSELPYQDTGQDNADLAIGKPEVIVSEFEQQIHSLINVERQKNNLPALSWDIKLNAIARKHSEDMASRNYFNHTTPEGIGLSFRYQQDGYIATSGCGENIFKSPMAKVYWYYNQVLSHVEYYAKDEMANVIVRGWMDSPGHRENILNPSWRFEGIGVAISSDDNVYITEDFA